MPVEILYKGRLGWQVDDLVKEPGGWVGVIAEFPDGREEIEFGDRDLIVEPTQEEVDEHEGPRGR